MTGPNVMPASSAPARRTRLVSVLSAVLVACTVGLSGCAIGTDSEPRALVVSTTTTAPPATPTSGGAAAVLYYVQDGRLVPVSLSLPDRQVGTVLSALFDVPDATVDAEDLTTSIPVGTELSGLRLDDGTLTLDLSGEFDNVVGPSRQQAIAQIVMTATEYPTVQRVRFEVDGDPIQVATPTRGDASTVTACDYRALLPSASDLVSAGLGSATVQRLEQRARSLAEDCPADK